MAIRRRRKTLTNLLSTMERRVTSVELRPINLLTSAQVAGALAGDDVLDEGPTSVVSLDAPNQYKAIVDGYYYSPDVSGKPRVELYFETDPGLSKDKTIRISGINKLVNGVDFDISDSYKVIEVDKEPYDTDRDTYGGKRNTPPETVVSTALFNPSIELKYSSARRIAVKSRISTVQATTTTATIVFTAPHSFKENQIVYVGVDQNTPYFGIDGLFRIKEVVSPTSITYDFDEAIPEPINVASLADESYVHAVAQSTIRNGATWFDTSQDPDVAYVWEDYRWVLFGSSSVTKDDVKPSPVTNLEADDENDTPPGATYGESRVTLTWDAPTTNENGKPLVDLIGYTIWSRQIPEQEWDKQDITGPETSWAKSGFRQGQRAYFAVFARDSGGNRSTPVEISYVTGEYPPEVQKPKAPAVTTYLGTIKIAYDDLTAFNLVQPPSAKEIEVFFSGNENFVPGPDNFYGTFPANAGSYIIIPGTELVRGTPLSDGVDYFIRIRVRDIYGNITEPSDPVSIKVKLSDIVTFDMIDVGSLTAQSIVGLQIDSNSNPSVNGGVSINAQGIVAYSPPSNGQPAEQTFRLNALNGAVSIGKYLGKEEAAGLYIATETAKTTYATITRADGIAFVAGNAQAVASAAQNGVTAARRDLDAITEIRPGEISVTLKKEQAIKAINKGIPNSNTTEIEGGVIRSRTILAARIGTGQFPADTVYANAINAGQINAGTLSGRTIQTDSIGQRIVIDSNQTTGNRIRIYNDSGTQVGQIVGGASGSSGLRLLYETGTEINLFDGSVSLRNSDASVRLTGTGTRAASRFTVDTAALTLFPLARAGVTTVAQTFGTGVTTGISLAGTGTRNVNAFSDGQLTTSSSDQRKKKNIEDLPLSLDFVNKLRPVQFEWKQPDPARLDVTKHMRVDSDDVTNMGLIAQELKATLEEFGIPAASIIGSDPAEAHEPYLDEGDTEPVLSIDYPQLIPALIKAVQELSAKIENLEKTQGSGD